MSMTTYVQCPIVGESTAELAPPLWILRLAGMNPRSSGIVDLNLMWHEQDVDWRCRWPHSAIEEILKESPSIVAFSSMAIDAGVAIDLSRKLKQIDPSVKIVFGGPFFGGFPKEVLSLEPSVDAVVTGGAEHIIGELCEALVADSTLSRIPGVTYRVGAEVRENAPGEDVDFESLGLIRFDLVDLERYWEVNPSRMLNLEFGRGCKYRCSFCYVSSHHPGKSQQMSPSVAAEQLKQAERLGAEEAFVVGDNFLNDRKWAIETCEEIASRNLNLKWTCYATVSDLDPVIAKALSSAGCSDVYIGVDAVGIDQKRFFNKRFVPDWDLIRSKLVELVACGVRPTSAFILSGIGDTRPDTEANLQAALDLALREIGSPRLNALVEYPGTGISVNLNRDEYEASSIKVDLLQDVPPPTAIVPDQILPPIYLPFHAVRSEPHVGRLLVLLTYDMSHFLRHFPHTLHAVIGPRLTENDDGYPLVDWWESEILSRVSETRDWITRRQQIDTALGEYVKDENSERLREVWRSECSC